MLSEDPNFEKKAADIIGLYLNPPDHAAVFCVDEKTQIQALERTQPGLPMKKGRGRTEFQRGILFQENGEWCVRPTGAQGSGVLRSMAQANCFIVLEHERGAVKAGEQVAVQLMEALA